MATKMDRRSCNACANSKRRCGKQIPHCIRCKARGIKCTYPPQKPSSFVLLEGDNTTKAQALVLISDSLQGSGCSTAIPSREPDQAVISLASSLPIQQLPSPCKSLQVSAYPSSLEPREVDQTGLSLALDLPGLCTDLVSSQLLASSWFDSQDTWKIYRFPDSQQTSFTRHDLEGRAMKIRNWLFQWVEKGSNPFIHPRMYRTRFLKSIQDAYTTLSCYIHKTTSNEQIIHQIVEDRVKNLIEDSKISINLDSLEHLARVQALMVYQIISLYDGDIRLRHLAESHIPILNDWMHKMVRHASHAVCLGGSLISSAHEQMPVAFSMVELAQNDNLLWYSWIVAESIRRTWIISSGIQAIYMAVQKDHVVPCMGGMMFTTRKGVWEAQSAPSWEKMCLEMNIGLIKLVDADKLFTLVPPKDLNDFSKLVLEITYGSDKLERWGVQVDN